MAGFTIGLGVGLGIGLGIGLGTGLGIGFGCGFGLLQSPHQHLTILTAFLTAFFIDFHQLPHPFFLSL